MVFAVLIKNDENTDVQFLTGLLIALLLSVVDLPVN